MSYKIIFSKIKNENIFLEDFNALNQYGEIVLKKQP